MSILSDPQIIAALLTVALTAAAAVAGYFLRERVSRSTPFMAVTVVDGDTKRHGTRIEIPPKVVKALDIAAIQSRIAEKAFLPDISSALTMANAIKTRGDEFLELAKQFKAAAAAGDQSTAQIVLAEIMLDEEFDHWISVLIGERAVQIAPYDASLPVLVECSEEPHARGGAFAIGFPGRAIHFGSDLNDFTLYKSGILALIEIVRRMELSKLSMVFDQLNNHVVADIAIAKDIAPLLQEIVDKYSQWSLQVYLANLGPTPFLVQREGTLEIEDRSGGKYSEPCSLIVIRTDEEKSPVRIEATSPLVVRAESDVTFEFVTNATQSEMTAGDTIRALFRAGSAKCSVRFPVDRPGMKRRQELRTPTVEFREI